MNNRKILNALPAYAGFDPAIAPDVFRILDKVDKIGVDGVERELTASGLIESDGEEEQGLSLGQGVAQKLRAFMEIQAESNTEMLQKLRTMLGDVPIGAEGLAELEQILSYIGAIGLDRIVIDPSVARGLGYYTGPVFETTLDDLPSIGSVCSGGRYDGLVSTFSDMKAPAVGASIGVDRFVDAMVKLGTLAAKRTTAQVLITRFDPKLDAEYLLLATALRTAAIKTEIYYGDEAAFKAQMAYATKQEIPVLVILGPDEQAKGLVSVKDMTARTQVKIPRDELVRHIAQILEG
jgi:histidyl-tRNA synthetase